MPIKKHSGSFEQFKQNVFRHLGRGHYSETLARIIPRELAARQSEKNRSRPRKSRLESGQPFHNHKPLQHARATCARKIHC